MKIMNVRRVFENFNSGKELVDYMVIANPYLKNVENAKELLINKYEFSFMVEIDNNYENEEQENALLILQSFLIQEFKIPINQQYIFKWDNVEYKVGSHYLVETNVDSCSFLVLKADDIRYLIIPTSIRG